MKVLVRGHTNVARQHGCGSGRSARRLGARLPAQVDEPAAQAAQMLAMQQQAGRFHAHRCTAISCAAALATDTGGARPGDPGRGQRASPGVQLVPNWGIPGPSSAKLYS